MIYKFRYHDIKWEINLLNYRSIIFEVYITMVSLVINFIEFVVRTGPSPKISCGTYFLHEYKRSL